MGQFKANKLGDVAFVSAPLIITYERKGRGTVDITEKLTVSVCFGVMNDRSPEGAVDFAPTQPCEEKAGRRLSDLSLTARQALSSLAAKGFAADAALVKAVCSREKQDADAFCSSVYAEAARLKLVREKTAARVALDAKIQEEQKKLMAKNRAKRAKRA